MKKYELLEKEENGLHRIKALKDFSDIKAGDIGGYVEKEDNLSHQGNCWVYGNARVLDNAIVLGNARVLDNARVLGNAIVLGNAMVSSDAMVYDDARVSSDAIVYGNAMVSGAVFNLSYDTYIITGTDNHLRIGCKQFRYEEWWNFTNEEIAEMDDGALEWWSKWKPILMLTFADKGIK